MRLGLDWLLLLMGAALNAIGIYLVKQEMTRIGAVPLTSVLSVVTYFLGLATSPLAVLGALAVFLAPFPYAVAVSRMALSVAYPASIALNCLILLPFAGIGLGEALSGSRLLAIGLIVLSVYLLSR
jgi:multidrug transporter EmrE-like cation transporter